MLAKETLISFFLYQGKKPPCLFDFDSFFAKIFSFVIELENSFTESDLLKFENKENYSKIMQNNLYKYLKQKYKMNPDNSMFISHLNKNMPVISLEVKEKYSLLLLKLNKLIKKCRKGEIINLNRLYEKVAGNGISALSSIPMALFSFMIAIDPRCQHEVNHKLNSKDSFKEYPHPVERVIFYAISFGGESNKIASMAGQIAGAFSTRQDLPKYLIEMCESYRDIQILANRIFELTLTTKDELMSKDEKKSTCENLNQNTAF